MANKNTPPVQIEGGMVSGYYEDHGQVAVFKGIPYAKAPVGENRWRPPEPADPWVGTKACKSFSPAAFQTAMDIKKFIDALIKGQGWGFTRTMLTKLLFTLWPEPKQSEDCLYLNIRTPSLEIDAKLPVMVWIHGGDHQDGSGSDIFYQSNAFAHRGVVLVTINYRLGIMGYFAHAELSQESGHGVSGNYGTLDQILALKWVQNNIAAFGGNSDNVTIFGESAGGESVAHMMTSPLSRGLFHKAIMQSAANSGQMIHLRHPFMDRKSLEESGKDFADLFVSSGEKCLGEMRRIPPKKLYNVLSHHPELSEFYPNIDGYVLEKSPFEVFLDGEQVKVPLLAGSNSDEATVVYPIFLTPLLELRRREVTPDNVSDLLKDEFAEDADKLFELYPGAQEGQADVLTEILTDNTYGAKAYFYAVQASKAGQAAYLYLFNRAPPSPRQTIGAYHGSELPFVFNKSIPISAFAFTREDVKLSEMMVDYWTQFAKTGNPNILARPEWPALSLDAPEYMVLDEASGKGPVERVAKYDILNRRLLKQIDVIKSYR